MTGFNVILKYSRISTPKNRALFSVPPLRGYKLRLRKALILGINLWELLVITYGDNSTYVFSRVWQFSRDKEEDHEKIRVVVYFCCFVFFL